MSSLLQPTYSLALSFPSMEPFVMRFAFVRRILQLACLTLGAVFLGGTGSAPADDQIKVEVLKKVKQATVRLRVTLADGTQVEGSGFFGAGPGLVLTNAHVLGMLRPESRKPRKVEIFINSGLPDEKGMIARTIGVDSSSDLALLAVPAKDAPAFLSVSNGDKLTETQSLFVFGFPFGEALGKNITVSKSSVSSLRKTEFGLINKIQVNGGMNPGNSGGPVVDTEGNVVGVAVSGISGTQINFAVPGRLVHLFLSGRVHRRTYEAPFKEGDSVKLPVTVETIDPLNRIRKVRVDTWTGDTGKARLIAAKDRTPLPGESPRKSQELEYKNGLAHGDLVLPEIPSGKVLWIEFTVVDQNGKETWTTAVPREVLPPLDRKGTALTYKHKAGVRAWNVVSETALKIRDREGIDHDLVFKQQADIIQTLTDKVTPLGEATATLAFNKPQISLKVDGKERPLKDDIEALKYIPQITVMAKVNAQGEFVSYRPDFKKVPAKVRDDAASFAMGVLKSFDAARAPLPTEEVAFGKPWKGIRELMIDSGGASQAAVADLSYNYMGTRIRWGKGEALVNLAGKVKGEKGEGLNLGGKIKGDAVFDLETGQVVSANTTMDVDLDLGEGRKTDKASGTLTVHLFQIIFRSEPEKK
jgi:hypothetical protein